MWKVFFLGEESGWGRTGPGPLGIVRGWQESGGRNSCQLSQTAALPFPGTLRASVVPRAITALIYLLFPSKQNAEFHLPDFGAADPASECN